MAALPSVELGTGGSRSRMFCEQTLRLEAQVQAKRAPCAGYAGCGWKPGEGAVKSMQGGVGGHRHRHSWVTWRHGALAVTLGQGGLEAGTRAVVRVGVPWDAHRPFPKTIHQAGWHAQVGHLDMVAGRAGVASPEHKASSARGDRQGSPCRQRAVGPQRLGWGTPRREGRAPWDHPVLRCDPAEEPLHKVCPRQGCRDSSPKLQAPVLELPGRMVTECSWRPKCPPRPQHQDLGAGVLVPLPLLLEGETHRLQSADDKRLVVIKSHSSSAFCYHQEPAILNHTSLKYSSSQISVVHLNLSNHCVCCSFNNIMATSDMVILNTYPLISSVSYMDVNVEDFPLTAALAQKE